MNHLKQTERFRRAALLPVANAQTAPSIAERALNLSLLLEELAELAEAYGLQGTFWRMLDERNDVAQIKTCDASNNDQMNWVPPLDTHEYNAVEALDALADLQVVLDGAVLTSGLQQVFPAALDEVYASNLSKTFVPYTEAVADAAAYLLKGEPVTLVGGGTGEGTWILRRDSDGKLMKPARFVAPNLHQFIQR